MNWIMTLRNKAGLVSRVGYTNKTQEQIQQIKDKWITEGVDVIKVSSREGR